MALKAALLSLDWQYVAQEQPKLFLWICQTARRNRNSSASRPSCRRRRRWQHNNLYTSARYISRWWWRRLWNHPRWQGLSQLATHRQIIKQFSLLESSGLKSWHNLTGSLCLADTPLAVSTSRMRFPSRPRSCAVLHRSQTC